MERTRLGFRYRSHTNMTSRLAWTPRTSFLNFEPRAIFSSFFLLLVFFCYDNKTHTQKKESIDGITHLGYPVCFATELMVFKVLGALALIIPQVPAKVKEWAYAGFTFDFICASVSYIVVDGFGSFAILPLIVLLVLIVSYVSYHKMIAVKN